MRFVVRQAGEQADEYTGGLSLEDLYKKLLDFSKDAVYSYTFDEGRILMANQGLVDILELDCAPAELSGRLMRELLVYTEKEGRIREALDAHGEIHDHEYHFRTLKGTEKCVLHNSFVELDESTGLKIAAATAKDITERKAAEQRIARLNRLYSVLSNINQAIIRVRDKAKLYEEACRIAMEDGGFPRAWICEVSDAPLPPGGQPGEGLDERFLSCQKISAEEIRRSSGAIASAISEGCRFIVNDIERDPRALPWRAEAIAQGYHAAAAFPMWVENSAAGTLNFVSGETGFFDAQEIALLAELADDLAFAVQSMAHEQHRKTAEEALSRLNRELEERITKRTAQLEAANKELESFSYSVSHDLRAPLRAVSGFSKMLLEDCAEGFDENGRRYLDVIMSSARKMGKLIDDLLVFSHLGRQQMRYSEIDMEGVVDEAAAEARLSEPQRDVRIDVIRPIPSAYGDRAMIRQVLVNLLLNAVKFTRFREDAAIEVGADAEGDSHTYYVKDNGAGFDMKYAHKLFGVFQRLHSEEEFDGTGVGLANVLRIVSRHGGSVYAKGEEGRGAVFSFTLPAKAPEETCS